MKTTRITLDVVHPNDVQPDEGAAAINKLLNVGLADAQDSFTDASLDNPEVQLADSLQIEQPIAVAIP